MINPRTSFLLPPQHPSQQSQQNHFQHSQKPYQRTAQKENHHQNYQGYIPNLLISKEVKVKETEQHNKEYAFSKVKFMNIFQPKLEKSFHNLT